MGDQRTMYVPLGPPAADGRQLVQYHSTETVLRNDQLYQLDITGTAELVRGPLGQIIDLIDRLEAEGLTVPTRIKEAVAAETEAKR